MRRRAFLSAVAAGLAGCAGRRESETGEPLVRVLITPRITMSGLFVAIEDGYFTEVGLRVEPTTITRSMQMIPLLLDGQAHAAMVGMSAAVINALDRGGQLRLVAARQGTSTTCGAPYTIYGNAQAFPNGIPDLRALRGKRVAFRAGPTLSEYAFDVMLERAGLTDDDVKLVDLGEREAVGALFAGRIDAMLAAEFEKDPSVVSGNYVAGPGLSDIFPNHQRGFIAFGRSMLEADHEIGVRFLAAYFRGVDAFLNGRTPAYLGEIARATGLDPEKVRISCRDNILSDGRIDVESVQRFIDWAASKEYCRHAVAAAQLIDSSYVEEARRFEWPAPAEDAGAEEAR